MVRLLVTAIVIAAMAGGGFWAYGEFASPAAQVSDQVPTIAVTKGDFRRTVDSIGEMKAARSALLNAPYSGQVVKLLEEGARVQKGDTLIWMETEEKEEQLKDHRNELGLAEKDLESAKEEYRLQEQQNGFSLKAEEARVEIAEQRYKDSQQKYAAEETLVQKKISPQSRLDEAELAMLQAGVELRNARINLQKTEENLSSNLRIRQTAIDKQRLSLERIQRRIEELEEDITLGEIKSPTDGEVSYLKVWKNGTSAKVAEGDSVWPRLSLVEIPDRSQMMAIVPVNELDVAQVEIGQEAIVTLEALPGHEFKGVVEKKSIVPISGQESRWGSSNSGDGGPREFEVQVKLLEADDMFRQGMTASVAIIVGEIEGVQMVPLETITDFEGRVGVWKHTAVEPTFVEVEVLRTNDIVAAIESELAEGDRVFLRDPTVELEVATARAQQALTQVRESINANNQKLSSRPPVGESESPRAAAPSGA